MKASPSVVVLLLSGLLVRLLFQARLLHQVANRLLEVVDACAHRVNYSIQIRQPKSVSVGGRTLC